ncbi:hypothetical protein [Heyndrickxia coagulans]|uniref:hypothetical protein n=1 Tax=Heyndrickxia coagulans TaxID=1398 RepID=UPI003462F992
MQANDQILFFRLAQRILSKQSDNGAWKLFADEENGGNLCATVEAYYACSFAGAHPGSGG